MENTEISMFMDVKMELNERKKETAPFKSWTKCLVKVDAVKCFPCYLRITFIRNVENESANLCIRINIPGVSIRMAKSRTKAHSYGMFYTQNRKRCTIFFSLDSEESYERHIKWMKRSIRILELHRQAILENRRTSRVFEENSKRIGGMREGKSLQDMLGPLPKIPVDFEENSEWSRRISGVSGIYEEIPENGQNPELPRTSVASGIYEEMKPPENLESFREDDNITGVKSLKNLIPPPLPPRKRINTLESDDLHVIPRCNTNPEDSTAKKKRYLAILGSVFGRGRRSESVSEAKVSSSTDFICTPEGHLYYNLVEQICNDTRSKNKFGFIFGSKSGSRPKTTSFSNPDLSKYRRHDIDDIKIPFSSSDYFGQMFNTLTSNFEKLNTGNDDHTVKGEILKSNEKIEEKVLPTLNANNSQETEDNLNKFAVTDCSNTNLVDVDLNKTVPSASLQSQEKEKQCNNKDLPPKILIDDLSGYCVMAPIKKKDNQKQVLEDSDKENEDTTAKPERKKIEEQQIVYETMHSPENHYVNIDDNRSNNITHIYQNIKGEQQQKVSNHDEYLQKIPRRSVNFDEKVPSYYPNTVIYDVPPKPRKRMNSNSLMEHSNQSKGGCSNNNNENEINKTDSFRENLYISSPERILEHRKLIPSKIEVNAVTGLPIFSSPLKARKISENTYTVTKSHDNFSSNYFNKQNDIISYSKQTVENFPPAPRVASVTFARISNKRLEKHSSNSAGSSSSTSLKKTVELSATTVRKFASLPRFRKIDFSPLRIKINSVLQRHNSEGL